MFSITGRNAIHRMSTSVVESSENRKWNVAAKTRMRLYSVNTISEFSPHSKWREQKYREQKNVLSHSPTSLQLEFLVYPSFIILSLQTKCSDLILVMTSRLDFHCVNDNDDCWSRSIIEYPFPPIPSLLPSLEMRVRDFRRYTFSEEFHHWIKLATFFQKSTTNSDRREIRVILGNYSSFRRWWIITMTKLQESKWNIFQ